MEKMNQKSCMHIINFVFVTLSVLFAGCMLEGNLNERLWNGFNFGNFYYDGNDNNDGNDNSRYPTITITGIPSRYFGWEAKLGDWVIPFTVITTETMTFDWNGPEYFSISLYLKDGEASMYYHTSEMSIITGNNIIPFSEFFNNTLTITITGIPSQYNNAMGILWRGNFGRGWPRVADNSAVFYIGGITSNGSTEWSSEIRLGLLHVDMGRTGATAGTMTTGGNSSVIPWSVFTEVPSITITGIPSYYAPSHLIYINISTPGTTNWDGHDSAQASRKNDWVSSNLWTANPGNYDVRLYTYDLSGSIIIDEYHAYSRNIGTGNNIIPFSSFTLQ